MKIAILTQPLQSNYGGLLQAYALQRILKDQGHDAWMLDFCKFEDYRVWNRMKSKCFLGLINLVRFIKGKPRIGNSNKIEESYVNQNTAKFIEKYITPITQKIYSPKQLRRLCSMINFDGYVVGSDQVWRPLYSPYIEHFFLDFCAGDNVKRLSYAASFGVDSWEYSEEETKRCAMLLKQFSAVSVRENTGVNLCKEYFDVIATQVLDPTMLLDRKVYEKIVNDSGIEHRNGDLFCYILDMANFHYDSISKLENIFEVKSFTTMPKYEYNRTNYKMHPEECVFPPVEAWLRSFMDAKMVVTDSFHGCVFSILFNKPFVALGNKERGQARFTSLLQLFGLETRLCGCKEMVLVMSQPIDWITVNQKLNQLKKESMNFLNQIKN